MAQTYNVKRASDIPELVINEVKKRPVLWDSNHSDYNNTTAKRIAWLEIVNTFSNIHDSEEKKKLLETELQKKWKNLRDSYVRELKRINTNKSTKSVKRKLATSLYVQKLSFLEKSIIHRDRKSASKARHNSSLQKLDSRFNTIIKSEMPLPVQETNSFYPSTSLGLLNCLENNFPTKEQAEAAQDDEDRLFCMSLYQEIKKVSELHRLPLKIEIYNLILRHQAPQNYCDMVHEMMN